MILHASFQVVTISLKRETSSRLNRASTQRHCRGGLGWKTITSCVRTVQKTFLIFPGSFERICLFLYFQPMWRMISTAKPNSQTGVSLSAKESSSWIRQHTALSTSDFVSLRIIVEFSVSAVEMSGINDKNACFQKCNRWIDEL